jgi:hypothetical protein
MSGKPQILDPHEILFEAAGDRTIGWYAARLRTVSAVTDLREGEYRNHIEWGTDEKSTSPFVRFQLMTKDFPLVLDCELSEDKIAFKLLESSHVSQRDPLYREKEQAVLRSIHDLLGHLGIKSHSSPKRIDRFDPPVKQNASGQVLLHVFTIYNLDDSRVKRCCAILGQEGIRTEIKSGVSSFIGTPDNQQRRTQEVWVPTDSFQKASDRLRVLFRDGQIDP